MSIFRSEDGLSTIEILISGLVVGFAAAGIALTFSTGNVWVTEMGTDRVALSLAQQNIERLVPAGIPASLAVIPGCSPTSNSCTETQITATGAACSPINVGASCFNRVTCVQYVSATDLTTPPYDPIDPTCPGGAATAAQRITVTVTPVTSAAGAAPLPQAGALPIVVQAWLQQ